VNTSKKLIAGTACAVAITAAGSSAQTEFQAPTGAYGGDGGSGSSSGSDGNPGDPGGDNV